MLRKIFAAIIIFCGTTMTFHAQSLSPSTSWHWQEGTIVTESPKRPEGQQHAIGLTAPRLRTVRVGFVGLGMRGPSAVARFCRIPGVEIVALCDYDASAAEKCQNLLRETDMPPAEIYSGERGYEALCQRPDIDLVYVATDWDHHFPVTRYAMLHGKHAAVEVPSAMNLEQCWELVNLAEQTRKHCLILENCCYDYYEMNALAMAQAGIFGEIIRAEGAYIHNLDEYWDYYWKNPDGSDPDSLGWRMKYNMENRGDLYATHGLGPVAQCLDIHRGDRFTTLVAMDTKSVNGKAYVERKTGKPCDNYRNGDHTTTLMRTARGKVVEIQHNVMTPQPYNRLFKLIGTKGYATKYPEEHFALDAATLKGAGAPAMDNIQAHGFITAEQQEALVQAFYHPILKKYGELGRELGHGGMDFTMDSRLVYCLLAGLPLDMDVYDMAEWCCLGELGALSMDHGCAAVEFPDFTRGAWQLTDGYRHAYATPEDEATIECAAQQFTDRLKSATKACNLWQLYDAKADGTARAAKAYDKARAKLDRMVHN